MDRRQLAAQGGCPAPPRTRHVHRGRQHARRPGHCFCAQSNGERERAPSDQAVRNRQGAFSHWPTSARSTSSRPDQNSPRIAIAPIRRWLIAKSGMLGRPSRPAMMPTRAQAEDLADQRRCRIGGIAGRGRCRCSDARRQPAGVRRMAEQRLHQHDGGRGKSGIAEHRADPPTAPAPAESPSDRLARRTRRARLLGLSA